MLAAGVQECMHAGQVQGHEAASLRRKAACFIGVCSRDASKHAVGARGPPAACMFSVFVTPPYMAMHTLRTHARGAE